MPDFSLEDALRARGMTVVAGVDEAGRGPLAGPVAAAAVILPGAFLCPGLDDSKKLSPRKREAIYQFITADPRVVWSVALASAVEIDALNILRATHLAMRRAVAGLAVVPDYCLIDGLPVRGFAWPHDGIVKGDGRSCSIAAASIIAKVTRDRLLRDLDAEFPQYGFAKHQGYGTKQHLEALRIHGPCCHHRSSFEPVAQLTLPFDRA
ncbi:MAG: ribonuclease HII [Verrucomicrobiota bacterium]